MVGSLVPVAVGKPSHEWDKEVCMLDLVVVLYSGAGHGGLRDSEPGFGVPGSRRY